MSKEHTAIWWQFLQAGCDNGWVGCLTPRELDACHVQTIRLCDLCHAVPKVSNRDGDNMLTGGEDIDDGAFLSAGPRSRVSEDRGGRLEKILKTRRDPFHDGRE